MTRYDILLVPIAIVAIVITNMYYIMYSRDVSEDFNKWKLDVVVNYATDAATDAMILGTKDLQMDSADIKSLTVEPETALKVFTQIMTEAYEIAPTNWQYVQNECIPMFCVVSYNGYYTAKHETINNSGAKQLIFSVKKPFSYRSGGNLYSLNLGMDNAFMFDGTKISKVDAPISHMEQLQVINTSVSNDLINVLNESTENKFNKSFYIPPVLTNISRTMPITNPTVLAYVKGFDMDTYSRDIVSFGIGGTRIVESKNCGSYMKNGEMLYAPLIRLDGTETLINVYESPIAAAEAGCKFDMKYL